jgi:hypothetical protein
MGNYLYLLKVSSMGKSKHLDFDILKRSQGA